MTHPLPPLPAHLPWSKLAAADGPAYSADQMREYACAALAAAPAPIYSKSVVKRLAVQMGLVSDDAPAAPAPTVVPLTVGQAFDLWDHAQGEIGSSIINFARAIERRCGITAAKE